MNQKSEKDSQIIVYKLKVHQTVGKGAGKTYIYVADVMKSLTVYYFNDLLPIDRSFDIGRLQVKAWHSSGQWCLEMLRLGDS